MPVLDQVLEQYPTQVKIVFKNFPIRTHRFAIQAAKAALAAESQGKFWQFHDLLFQNYSALNNQKIQEIVLELGLDEEKFGQQLKDPQIMSRIKRDINDAKKAGVRGTPTVFINGKRLRNRTLPGFQAILNKEFEKLGKTGSVKAQ